MVTNFLYYFIRILFEGLIWLIFIRVLLSWFPIDPYSPLVRILRDITDPILEPFHRIIPPMGGFDLSPIAAMIVLELLEQLLLRMIFGY